MNKLYGVLVIFCLILLGCGSDSFFRDELMVAEQRKLFETLCQSPKRYLVNDVIAVDGYLTSNAGRGCTLGWDPILRHGYRYAECVDEKIEYNSLLTSKVFYFTLEERGSQKCETAREFLLSREPGGQGATNRKINYENEFMGVIGDRCLAIEYKDRALSRYEVYLEFFYIYEGKQYTESELSTTLGNSADIERKKGMISASSLRMVDRYSGRAVAQRASYVFFPNGILHRTHSAIKCEQEMPTLRIHEVLKPR